MRLILASCYHKLSIRALNSFTCHNESKFVNRQLRYAGVVITIIIAIYYDCNLKLMNNRVINKLTLLS